MKSLNVDFQELLVLDLDIEMQKTRFEIAVTSFYLL